MRSIGVVFVSTGTDGYVTPRRDRRKTAIGEPVVVLKRMVSATPATTEVSTDQASETLASRFMPFWISESTESKTSVDPLARSTSSMGIERNPKTPVNLDAYFDGHLPFHQLPHPHVRCAPEAGHP